MRLSDIVAQGGRVTFDGRGLLRPLSAYTAQGRAGVRGTPGDVEHEARARTRDTGENWIVTDPRGGGGGVRFGRRAR